MIQINVSKQSNYPVSLPKLKNRLKEFLQENGIVSDSEVSIALVGEEKALSIADKYLGDKKVHNVLSFTPDESKEKFIYPPDNIIHLGEIIVCYPLAFKEANIEGKLIEDKVYELIEHGAMHLMGKHHE